MRISCFLAALALASFGAASARAGSFTPDQTKEIQAIIKSYLVEHPEVMEEAVDALQKQEAAKTADAARTAIRQSSAELLKSPDDIVLGNPRGDVSLVEFYDYRCGYCKGAYPQIEALIAQDHNVRLVMKQFPILGPDSLTASRAVFAAKQQGADKQLALHKALIEAKNPIDEAKVFDLAAKAGLNVETLKEAMKDPRITEVIAKTKSLAAAIHIDGTPSFILGDQLIPGVVSTADMKVAVDKIRKAS